MKSIIYQVKKEKTNIRGFWKDESGKVYIDNIKQKAYSHELKRELFESGELAVFYINSSGQGIIEDKSGDVTVLKNKFVTHYKTISKELIKGLLNFYGGITVYKNLTFNDYTIEAWQ